MKAALRIYSDILQLRRETIAALLATPAGIAFAFKLFAIVLLIAGMGRLFAIPVVIQQPVLSEELSTLGQRFDRSSARAIEAVDNSLQQVNQENVSRLINQAINDLIAAGIDASAETLGGALADAGVTREALTVALENVAAAPEQFGVLAEEVSAAQSALATQAEGALVSSELVDQLLAELDLTPAQLMLLLDRAPDLSQLAASAEAERATAGQQFLETAAQIPLTPAEIRQTLVALLLTPETMANLSVRLGLTDEQIAAANTELTDGAGRISTALTNASEEAARLEPPLGTRASRVTRVLGQWLATPFAVMAEWLLFALVALVAAKLLGGRGTVAQHLAAVALAAAPAVLLFVSYIPELRTVLPFSYDYAIEILGRALTLIALVWMGMILLKTLAIGHRFSLWRAGATLIVTWLIVWVVLPAATTMAVWYLVRG